MSEPINQTVTLELTLPEYAAVQAAVVAVLACSKAATTRDPGDIAAMEILHEQSHHTLADAPLIIDKLRAATAEVLGPGTDLSAARAQWDRIYTAARDQAAVETLIDESRLH